MSRAAAVDGLFADKDLQVRTVYEQVLSSLAKVGPMKAEAKKTSMSTPDQKCITWAE